MEMYASVRQACMVECMTPREPYRWLTCTRRLRDRAEDVDLCREGKSISSETTLAKDTDDVEVLRDLVARLN